MTTRHHNPREPFTDHDSSDIIDEAAAALSAERADEWAGDITVEIHVLASLRLQLDTHLRSAVTAAHEAGHHWPDLAELLGVTPDKARHRYKAPQHARTPRPGGDRLTPS